MRAFARALGWETTPGLVSVATALADETPFGATTLEGSGDEGSTAERAMREGGVDLPQRGSKRSLHGSSSLGRARGNARQFVFNALHDVCHYRQRRPRSAHAAHSADSPGARP